MKILIPITAIIFVLTIGVTSTFAEDISDATTNLLNYDIQDGKLAIMWLGNHQKGSLEGYASAGFLLRTSNYTIAIDPSSLLLDDIDSLDMLDAIFITHDHGDHFDPYTTIAMQTKTSSFVIADPTSASMLIDKIPEDKLIKIEPNEKITISGITVDAFPAEHPTKTPLVYVIEFDGFRIFYGSDSGFVEDLKNIEPRVHVAIVPTGSPSPTASPQDAFEMTKAANPYVVIPMHGSPQQMQEFSNLVENSNLQTIVTIPSPLEIIIPLESNVGFTMKEEKRAMQGVFETERESMVSEMQEKSNNVDNGGGCLIATAAYGTELAPQVQLLREIRDNTVMSTASGMAFMTGFNQLYYSFSPIIADMQRENPMFQEAVRAFITPMISSLSIMTLAEDGSEVEVLGLGISVITLNLGMYIAAPVIVVWQVRKRI